MVFDLAGDAVEGYEIGGKMVADEVRKLEAM